MKRNLNLDILRITATLMVLIVHIGMQIPAETFESIGIHNTGFVYIGAKGVQLFFILSGYLGCFSYKTCNTINDYYKKRIIRIIPSYYFALVFSWIFYCIFDILFYKHKFLQTLSIVPECDPLIYVRYLTFVHHIIPSHNYEILNNLNGLWTMSAFFIFYLIAPLLLKFINSFKRSVVCTLALMFITPIMSDYCIEIGEQYNFDQWENFVPHSPLMCLYCFLLGVCVYYANKDSFFFSLGYIVIIFLIFSIMNMYYFEFLFTALLLIATNDIRQYGNTVLIKCLGYLSEGSFSVYLFHPLIIFGVVRTSVRNNYWGGGRMIFEMFFISLIISYLIHFLVVKRLEKVLRGWMYRIPK